MARPVFVYDDLEAMSGAAAAMFADLARDSVDRRGRFAVALAGGQTPRRSYEIIAERHADRVPWDRTDVFFTDERCVPLDAPESNYAMANASLLARVPIEPERVHPIRAFGIAPSVAAEGYEAELRQALAPVAGGGATFDLLLLGIGADGHIASLFPGDPAVSEQKRWVVAVDAPMGVTPRQRISLTVPVLSGSRHVIVLAAGAAKRNAVSEALDAHASADGIARPLVSGTVSTRWLVDAEAASIVKR